MSFVDETVWLTQQQLCDLYQTSKSNISEHIKHIFEEEELEENAVVRKFRTTASDEKNILLPSLHYEAGHSNSFTIANRYSSCSSSQSVHHPGVRLHCPHKLLHFFFYQSLLFFIYKELYLYRSFAISVIWHRCFPHS